MSQTSLTASSVLGIILESLLCGTFLPLLLTAGYVQWRRRVNRHSVNKIMVFATVFYGVMIILHWAISLYNALRGILFLPPGESTETFFQNVSSTLVISKVSLLQVEIMVGDWIMVYRLYHIAGKKFPICIVPLLGSIGQLVILIKIIAGIAMNSSAETIKPWIIACFVFTIFNCFCNSSLIAIRLWMTHNMLPEYGIRVSESIVMRALYLVVESAALWSIFVIINFTLILLHSDFELVFLDVTGPVIGISFCLIIIRLGYTSERLVSFSQPRTLDFVVPMTTTNTGAFATSSSIKDEPGTTVKISRVGQ